MAACTCFPSSRLCYLCAHVTCLFCGTPSPTERENTFPVKSILCAIPVLTKLPVPLPICLGITLNLGCHRLFASVAYACITKSAFVFKLIEDQIAGGGLCKHAHLQPRRLLAPRLRNCRGSHRRGLESVAEFLSSKGAHLPSQDI